MYADFCKLPTRGKQQLPNLQPSTSRRIWSIADRLATPPIKEFQGVHMTRLSSFVFHSSEPFCSERYVLQFIRNQKEDVRRVQAASTCLEKRHKRFHLHNSVCKKGWHFMLM